MTRSLRNLPQTIAAFAAGIALAAVTMASDTTSASTGPSTRAPYAEAEITSVYGGSVQLVRDTAWAPAVLHCESPDGSASIRLGSLR